MSSTTVVSAFYPLEKSKHTIQEYISWIHNFVTNIDSPIVLFTDNPFCSIIQRMREEAKLADKLYIIQKPFDEVKFSTAEWIDIWENQLKIDKFAHCHGHELFRVWANKPFFVQEAIEINPFKTTKFVWCDAGCWRDPTVAKICGPGWPVSEKITSERMHIITINSMKPYLEKLEEKSEWTHSSKKSFEDIVKEIDVRNIAIVGGTILLGDIEAWQTWVPLFEECLSLYIKNNLFAGDDQSVITSTTLWLRYSNPTKSPILYDAPKNNHFFTLGDIHMGDLWFAFQEHFSRHDFKLTTY